jgi:hypothetical protein
MPELRIQPLRNFTCLAIVVLIEAILMVILYGQIDYTIAPYANWDLTNYRNMAAASPEIATNICRPFAFRVLGPYLVGLLPISDPQGFYIFSVLASVGLVFLLYRFLCASGLSPSVAAITVVLFTFNRYWFGFTVWNYFQINDLLSLIWIVVLFSAMLRGRWIIFCAALFLGSLTRETSMLMIPVVFAYLWERKELRRQWRPALVAIIPGFITFFLLRILIPSTCGLSLFEALPVYASKILSPDTFYRLLINSFLPLSLIPLVFYEITFKFFRTRLYALLFVVVVFASAFFGENQERLMAPAFLVVYALMGNVIQEHCSERMFLAVLIGGGFLCSLHYMIARYPLPDRTVTVALSLGSLLVITVVAFAYRLKRGRGPHREEDIYLRPS